MTWIEIVLDHVESKAKDQPQKWEQVMNNYQELVCLTNVGDCTMAIII
jgi:hypothetical protein